MKTKPSSFADQAESAQSRSLAVSSWDAEQWFVPIARKSPQDCTRMPRARKLTFLSGNARPKQQPKPLTH